MQSQICGGGFDLCSGGVLQTLKGINYFGFEDGQTSFDGLWQGPSALSYGAHHRSPHTRLNPFTGCFNPAFLY